MNRQTIKENRSVKSPFFFVGGKLMKLNNYQTFYAGRKPGVFVSMIGKLSLIAVMLLLSQVLSGKDINIDLSANNIFDGKRVVNYGIVPAFKNDKGLTVIARLQSSPYKKGTYAGAVTKLGKDGKIEFALNQAGWNNRFGFYVKNSQRDAFIHISPSLLFSKEHLVVGVFSPNMITVYVDGKKVSSAKRNNNRLISTAGPLLIGALETDKNFFKGKISQVKIMNRALTEKDIKKLSNTIKKDSIMEVVSPPELEFNRSLRFAPPSFKDYQTNMQIVDYRIAPEATLDEIKTIINQVKKKGFDTFFLSGSFRYMFARKYGPRNWWNAMPWPIYLKTAKRVSKACNDAGLKFVVHLTVNLILYPDLPRFKEMGTRDITTKKEVEWPNYYGRCMCVNNPDFKAKLHARLHELVSKTNLDGLMIDEIAFSPSEESCGCDYCAAGFKKAYGYDIPLPKDKSVWNNYDSPIWRAWLTFRRDSISRHAKDIKNILDSYGPDKILTGCSYNPAEAHIVRMCGYDTFTLPYTVHFFENEPFHPWSWRHGLPNVNILRLMANLLL